MTKISPITSTILDVPNMNEDKFHQRTFKNFEILKEFFPEFNNTISNINTVGEEMEVIHQALLNGAEGGGFSQAYLNENFLRKSDAADTDNYLINAEFDVWTIAHNFPAGADVRIADGWSLSGIGGTRQVIVSKGIIQNGGSLASSQIFSMCTIVIPEGGLDYQHNLTQKIEDVAKFSGEDEAVGFWIYSSVDIDGEIEIIPALHYGVGGDATEYLTSKSITLVANTWTFIPHTFTCPDMAAKTIGVNNNFSFNIVLKSSFSSAAVLYITKVKMQRGKVPTPLKRKHMSQTVSECRYVLRKYATQQNVSDLAYEMRTTPTESGTGPYIYDARI